MRKAEVGGSDGSLGNWTLGERQTHSARVTGAGRDWGDHGMVCCRGSWYEAGKGKENKPLGRGRASTRVDGGGGDGRRRATAAG